MIIELSKAIALWCLIVIELWALAWMFGW